MDLISLCALLQTQLPGPWVSLLMKSRDNPLQVLGFIGTVIVIVVAVMILISTAMFMHNKKSNRTQHSQRIIRKRACHRKQGNFQSRFKQPNKVENFTKHQGILTSQNDNFNNNILNVRYSPHGPPSAPLPPPLPCSYRQQEPWVVPTVSASLSQNALGKKKKDQRKENQVNTALVSELKLKLEQKKMMNQC